jgi:hypothetical protein
VRIAHLLNQGVVEGVSFEGFVSWWVGSHDTADRRRRVSRNPEFLPQAARHRISPSGGIAELDPLPSGELILEDPIFN